MGESNARQLLTLTRWHGIPWFWHVLTTLVTHQSQELPCFSIVLCGYLGTDPGINQSMYSSGYKLRYLVGITSFYTNIDTHLLHNIMQLLYYQPFHSNNISTLFRLSFSAWICHCSALLIKPNILPILNRISLIRSPTEGTKLAE